MRALWTALLLMAAVAAHSGAAHADSGFAAAPAAPGGLCGAAILAAQGRHAVPSGLLFAIGQVESGRPDPVTHRLVPWPWTVQAQNQSYYFTTKAEAVAWVQAAQARNIVSIDVGCMQINLMYHPTAFQNLDAAFDPDSNAEYAARFLVSLHAATADWQKASGLYHSQTLALAVPYAQKVEAAMTGKLPAYLAPPPPKPTMLALLQAAWGATINTPAAVAPVPMLDNSATVLPVVASLAEPSTRPRSRFHRLRLRQEPILLSYEH